MLSELSLQGLRDRQLLLRSLPAYALLEDGTLSLLAEHSRLRPVREGEVLLQLQEPIHHVYNVLEGSVQWRRKNREPRVAGPQEVVGWLTLMARDPDGMDAIALRDSLVLELPAEMLEHVLEEDFAIVRNMMRMGATQLLKRRGNLPVAPLHAPGLGDPSPEHSQRRTMVERVIDMRKVPMFSRCNVEALIALTRRSRDVTLAPGDVLWRVGERSTFWLLIEEGSVRCTNAAGESVLVQPHFVLGVMDAIGQQLRTYEARAEETSFGNQIDLEAFLAVLETHFDLARDFVSMLARAVLDES